MESACGGRNVAAADGVRHPFGVLRSRWFRVTGVALSLHRLPVVLPPLRGSPPARREGKRRFDERMNANSTGGQTPLRRENECHFDERTIVNPRKPRRGDRPQAGGEARKGATPA